MRENSFPEENKEQAHKPQSYAILKLTLTKLINYIQEQSVELLAIR